MPLGLASLQRSTRPARHASVLSWLAAAAVASITSSTARSQPAASPLTNLAIRTRDTIACHNTFRSYVRKQVEITQQSTLTNNITANPLYEPCNDPSITFQTAFEK